LQKTELDELIEEYIGKRLNGRYELIRLIGCGGMANVFEANDLAENRVVAVKILKEEYLTNDEFVRRFRNESKIISVLDHKNIVKVYDVNFTGAEQYIVMEYIDGITLNQYVKHEEKLRWKDAVHFAKQILQALEHAHEHGVIHRDIKSQNIMLLRDGSIKVMDFGIARFAREDIRSMNDKAIGSVHYISPEQACGKEADAKSDIYSVGILLYEMLTGTMPFTGTTPEGIAMQHMKGKAKPVNEVNPEVPEGLCEIVEKAMKKDKNLRYRSAKEMLSAIAEFKENPSIRFEYKYLSRETNPETLNRSVDKIQSEELSANDDKEIVIKKSPTILILTGIAFACIITAILVLIGFFYWGRSEKVAEINMPDFVGQHYEDVKYEYRKFNFVIEERELTDDYDSGVIYAQNIQPGITVKENRTVRIKVSEGYNILEVPDIVGKDISEAEEILFDMGFDYTVHTQDAEDVPVDQVIKTDPPKGTKIEKNTQVIVYVSRGKAQVASKVPKVVGLPLDEAKLMLEAAGLIVSISEVDSNEAPNTVITQSLAANEYIKEGTSIVLAVSNGSGYYKKATLSVDFPPDAASKQYKLVVYIDGEEKGNAMVDPSTSPTWNVTVNGNGTQKVIISIDGVKYCEYEVDFDKGVSTLTQGYYDEVIDRLDGDIEVSEGEPDDNPMSAVEVQ